MPKYLAVTHRWFVDSKGFHVKEFEAENDDIAERERLVINDRLAENFKHASTKLIRLEPDLRISPRRLTWRERLTGKIT